MIILHQVSLKFQPNDKDCHSRNKRLPKQYFALISITSTKNKLNSFLRKDQLSSVQNCHTISRSP